MKITTSVTLSYIIASALPNAAALVPRGQNDHTWIFDNLPEDADEVSGTPVFYLQPKLEFDWEHKSPYKYLEPVDRGDGAFYLTLTKEKPITPLKINIRESKKRMPGFMYFAGIKLANSASEEPVVTNEEWSSSDLTRSYAGFAAPEGDNRRRKLVFYVPVEKYLNPSWPDLYFAEFSIPDTTSQDELQMAGMGPGASWYACPMADSPNLMIFFSSDDLNGKEKCQVVSLHVELLKKDQV